MQGKYPMTTHPQDPATAEIYLDLTWSWAPGHPGRSGWLHKVLQLKEPSLGDTRSPFMAPKAMGMQSSFSKGGALLHVPRL